MKDDISRSYFALVKYCYIIALQALNLITCDYETAKYK